MQDKGLAKKIKTLREQEYTPFQCQALASYQQGGKINGYDNVQKPIKRILRDVGTNEIKEGNLSPGNYMKVIYEDDSIDYLTKDGERQLSQMPNYINYLENLRKEQSMMNNNKQVTQNNKNTPYFQQAGIWNPAMLQMPNIQNQQYAPQQNFSQSFPQQPTAYAPGSFNSWDQDNNGIPDYIQRPNEQAPNAPLNLVDTTKQSPAQQQEYNTRYNIMNPYGGIDLGASLNYTGQQFGEDNVGMGVAGAGLSFLKGAREFMTGYGSGRESQRVRNEYLDNTFGFEPNFLMTAQQGGQKITNAQMFTNQFVADEGQGNTNVENGEFIRRADTGQVQQVVGESHIQNGKKADGVNVTLNNGDKVLSDYTKIPAKNVKELKERYKISLKKDATFADAQKAYDKKLGIQKTTDELAGYIEKLGENENTKDETAKRLNEMALAREIEEYKTKLDVLKDPQSMIFEDLFAIQESLPKISGGNVLLDDKGNPIEGSEGDVTQQGGLIELASKHGITPERAKELIKMQMGGEMAQQTEDPMQQVFQAVAQMLTQGVAPEQISEQLIAQGIPPEQVGGIIEQVIQQLQAQPQEQQMAQEGLTFQTGIPTLAGYDITSQGIVPTQTLTGVEPTQAYATGQGYGKQLADVDKLMDVHAWYFDTEEKRKAFKEASKKEGTQPEVKAFQEAYNNEIVRRAKSAGVPEQEAEKLKKTVGFSNEGARKLDGLFGAFTSTRPLFDIAKKPDGTPEVIEVASPVLEQPLQQIVGERTENVAPWLPQALRTAPSALDPIALSQINLPRMEAIKLTPEGMLAEQERQRQTDVARVQASGLTPLQQEALLASGLSSSQLASNDAIAKTEMANLQSQASANQFNLGQSSKEDITNAQFRNQYQDQVMSSLANQESAWKNYYNQAFLDQNQKFKDVNNLNLLNAQYDNFQFVPGQGVVFNNTTSTDFRDPNLEKEIGNLTTEERNKFVQEVIGGQSRYNALIKARTSR